MRTQIRSPLRPILVVLLVGCVAAACLWIFDYCSVYSPDGQLSYIGVSEDMPPPNEDEINDAMGIVREAGWIEAIAGNQDWALLGREWGYQPRWIAIPNAKKLDISFTAVWEHPVDSDGPWILASCKMTRLTEGFRTFTNIRAIRVIVDIDRRIPMTRSVASPFFNILESASPSNNREAASPSNASEIDSWNPKYHGIPSGKEKMVITDAITGEVLYEGHHLGVPWGLRKCPPDLDTSYRD